MKMCLVMIRDVPGYLVQYLRQKRLKRSDISGSRDFLLGFKLFQISACFLHYMIIHSIDLIPEKKFLLIFKSCSVSFFSKDEE